MTDHQSLCWLVGLRDPSGRLARWALRLQEFDFSVTYKSGHRHTDAECLSRLPQQTQLSAEDGCIAPIYTTISDALAIRLEQRKDARLQPFFNAAQASSFSASLFIISDGLLWRRHYSSDGARFLLVVPVSLRPVVLRAMHDDVTAGHLGFIRTLYRVHQRFYWPQLRKTTKQYVASCEVCQRYKRPTVPAAGLLHPVRTPTSPFEKVGVDLLGPFPKSAAGNRWLLVCVDYLTR